MSSRDIYSGPFVKRYLFVLKNDLIINSLVIALWCDRCFICNNICTVIFIIIYSHKTNTANLAVFVILDLSTFPIDILFRAHSKILCILKAIICQYGSNNIISFFINSDCPLDSLTVWIVCTCFIKIISLVFNNTA